MLLQKAQKKNNLIKSNESLVSGMWKMQNIKSNITKLSKIPKNLFFQLNQTSINALNSSRSMAASPDKSTQHSMLLTTRCKNCESLKLKLRNQKIERDSLQRKFQSLVENLNEISKQNVDLRKKCQLLQKMINETSEVVKPYQSNVVLMEQHLNCIKDSLNQNEQEAVWLNFQDELNERKKNMDSEFNFLQKTHRREQQNSETKINRLNHIIGILQGKNKQQQILILQLNRNNKILQGIINQSKYVVQQRQLFCMANEEIYQLKIQQIKDRKQKQQLARLTQKLKNKIYMLTSLIGYGVVSNIQNNDLHQLFLFKQNIQQVNRIQARLSSDLCGLESLKANRINVSSFNDFIINDQTILNLYQPSFLILFQDQQITNALQQNATTIIKTQFFMMIRAILDSKFDEFLLEKHKATRFSDFTYAFIDFFRIRKNEKRIELNFKKNNEQNQFMKTNFLLRIFDRKIGFLPEMETFRQFLIKNTCQDEVFYYLMCRNLLMGGPQLDNYINCGDPYTFIPYARVMKICQNLLEKCDIPTKAMIFNHLNLKKVIKNKNTLLKSNYVLRILLQVYRKIKYDKIAKLRVIFQQTCRFTKSEYVKFVHFKELLKKNFTFLNSIQISEYYRKTLAIFHTNKTSFFDSFSVTSLQFIFLSQNLIFYDKLKSKLFSKPNQQQNCNYLLELMPDSVSQLGNESIYCEYLDLIKLKGINIQNRAKISKFLIKMTEMRLWSCSQTQKQKLSQHFDFLNNRLIDFLNQNFRKRKEYEKSVDKASHFIGKQFKKKIYQFYSQFVRDIRSQIDPKKQN